jgi:hypothetical protein
VRNRKQYYSVTHSVKIGGAGKRPAVCYALTDDVAAAVEQLAAIGQARIYDEEVRFVSGRELPVRRAPVPAAPAAPAPAPAVAIPAPAAVASPVPFLPLFAEPAEPAEPAVLDPSDDPIAAEETPDAGREESEPDQPGDSAENEESAVSDEGSGTGRKPRRTK